MRRPGERNYQQITVSPNLHQIHKLYNELELLPALVKRPRQEPQWLHMFGKSRPRPLQALLQPCVLLRFVSNKSPVLGIVCLP